MIRILDSREIPVSEIVRREPMTVDVEQIVADIVAEVRNNGDAALLRYTEKFDGAVLQSLEVTSRELEEAWEQTEPEFLEILQQAAQNIRDYHSRQLRQSYLINEQPGILLGQKILPLEKAGLYIPGGTAAYPSTVLMNCIPAKIAGVGEIVMVTPPRADGSIAPEILAAAKVAGVDRVFKVGGSQAIAALAYGTPSIPKVDKITGPGNVFVAEAKRQVYGLVSIDMIAGPSEVLILADESCNARFAAADMLAQAEHDKLAAAVLITTSRLLAEQVAQEVERQLHLLPRESIAAESIARNGKIILTESLEEAVELANLIAPEHLEICTENPFAWMDRIRHAGSVFLGQYCPEALGDYLAGPNHTLPTGGTARFSSAVSVDDFIKKTQFLYYTREALAKVQPQVTYFAEKEGLQAHGRSAAIRFEEEQSDE